MTFTEFSQRLKDVVLEMGSNPLATRPQTYAVLNDLGDLNAEQKGYGYRDNESPFFYSKAWADAGTPSELITRGAFVYAYKVNANIPQAFQQKHYKALEQVRLYLVDELNSADANDIDSKAHRNAAQVIEDCDLMMAELLQRIVRVQEIRNGIQYSSSVSKEVIRGLGQQDLYGVMVTLTLKVRYCID